MLCRPVQNLSRSTGAGLNEMAKEAASVLAGGLVQCDQKKQGFVCLCSSVCDIKAPVGSVRWRIWECRNKSEMTLPPSPVATRN